MNNDNLSFQKLLDIWDALNPILYYATVDNCERNKILWIKEGEYNPEYIVFHPDDFEEIKSGIVNRRLVSLADYPAPNKPLAAASPQRPITWTS